MDAQALKLTVHAGERERAGDGLLADELIEIYRRSGVRTSVLLRGAEGFGIKHRLRTDRLLTLSEDLPVLAVALDTPERIETALGEVGALAGHGLITLERALLLGGGPRPELLGPAGDSFKLTIYIGRQARAGARAAHLAILDCLHAHGLAGATVLLGVDGITAGVRRRGRFLAANREVPLMIIAVGDGPPLARALGELEAMLPAGAITLERVRVCKRDGQLLSEPQSPPAADAAGHGYWQRLVVYASERTRHGSQPLYGALIRALRAEGAAGATALRGLRGYHGDHRPHGERLLSVERHVPVLTVVIDTPANTQRWFAIVDEMTRETGLVTSEIVPALRAAGPGVSHGGLELAAALARPE